MAFLNTCHSPLAADTAWVYPVPPHILWTTFNKCLLSTGTVADRRSLTPKEGYIHYLANHISPSPCSFFSKYKTQYTVCQIACNLMCIWQYFASKKSSWVVREKTAPSFSPAASCMRALSLQAPGHPQGREGFGSRWEEGFQELHGKWGKLKD